MAALLLWLLSVGVLLFSSDALTEYDKLPKNYRSGVDSALEKVNSHPGIRHHFLFFASITKSAFEPGFDVSYINHHFNLKATSCQKGTVDSSGCQFREVRPLIDCVTCYKSFEGEIEQEPEPFVHCVHKPALTEEMRTMRNRHCRAVGYHSGSAMLLSSSKTK